MAVITPEVYTSMGLLPDEYDLILRLLGRTPTYTELGMFAVMWSEHCGYKYSRPVLGYFKGYKEAMEGAGLENAGIVDIGDGLGVTMKVESHNHPSAVEPYQGAATGVGGIIRDILTMGARPIAVLNSLRFGPIHDGAEKPEIVERNRYLFEHVVSGIAGYGNCVGVPTVAGEVNFHARYSGNPLVNAMCVGMLKLDEVTTAAATGVGNPVIYLGSATGKDGIHGATFASDNLGEDNDSKRPNVQIGDPFAEKQVIEATLEALQTGAIVAIQDMGAAGLTCSTIEMASKGGVGMEVNLDLVPMRELDMTGYELMLSESQERMLCIAIAGREDEVIQIFRKWGQKAEVIGHVIEEEIVTVRRHGVIEAQVDPKLLTDHCPVYKSTIEEPEYFRKAAQFDPSSLPKVSIYDALLKLLAHPDIASKKWVFDQYDQQVQTQTTLAFGQGDAAVLAPRGSVKGISLKIDGNARQTFLHPYRGGVLAVAEAARNVACTGAKPKAATDGLNFGNPTMPHVYWQFERAVRGVADAAEALATPVVSGNVSFYNQSDLGEVLPTPLIGILGVLDRVEDRLASAPSGEAELFVISIPDLVIEHEGLGASLYASVLGVEDGYPVMPDLAGELRLINALVDGASNKVLVSAHDSSEGGLAVSLAEIAIQSRLLVDVDLTSFGENPASSFGEIPGRVVVSTNSSDALNDLANRFQLALTPVGKVKPGSGLKLKVGNESVDWTLETLEDAFEGSIPSIMVPH